LIRCVRARADRAVGLDAHTAKAHSQNCGGKIPMKRALFICTQNRLRSPTAEQVFSSWAGVGTDSAGLGSTAESKALYTEFG
jgi:hypothetical protein